MATKIVTKNSSTASAVPTASDLVQGELAVNVADKRLFTEDNGGAIVELGTNPSTIDINAGSIDGTAIGASTASTGAFTTLTATGAFTSLGIDDNATSTAITIDSSENVGIGASSPEARLHASGGENSVHAVFGTRATRGLEIGTMIGGDGATDNTAFYNMKFSSNGSHVWQAGGAERMRIDSIGNVGIGTSSPARPLDITDATSDGSGGVVLHSYLPTVELDDISGGGTSFILQQDGANTLFKHDTTERMRIDSSGNLLVGTTSTATNDVGHKIFGSTGQTVTTASGTNPVLFNRKTSDGDIAVFRKDDTTVGSIGTEGGDLTIGNADTGLQFVNTSQIIRPQNLTTNAAVDAQVSLGQSAYRFKDLYLSGGVYLGGTGAANKLDDYEEGTWTPTVSGGVTSPAYTAQSGSYTKIGNLVYFQFRLDLSSGTAAVAQFKFGGLPFTSKNVNDYGGAWISYSLGFLDDLGTASWHIGPNNTEIYAYETDGSTMTGIELDAIGNVLGNVYLNGVYRVA